MAEKEFTDKEKLMVLLASSFGIIVLPFLSTSFNIAQSAVMDEFNVSIDNIGWLTSLYLLAIVVFMIPAGRLCYIFGKKKIFQIGLLIILVMLIIARLFSVSYPLVCFYRIIMGAGLGCVSCSSMSLLTEAYPPNKRGWALGVNTACVYLGLSLGPIIGGFVTEYTNWKGIFVTMIPFVLVALFLISKIDIGTEFEKKPFDYGGAVLYGLSMILLLYGMMEMPEWYSFVLMACGAVMTFLFIKSQKKHSVPLLDLKIFDNKVFDRSLVALLLNYAASYAVSFFMSLYLQRVGALRPDEASMILIAQPVVQVIFSLFMGKLSDKMDKRILPTIGMLIIAFGLFILTFLTEELNYPLIICALMILGLGFGIFSAPNTNAIMSSVKNEESNEASAIMNATRQMGMTLSIGLATVFISVYMGSLENFVPESFMEAMRNAWILFIGFGLVGAAFSWFRGKSEKV